VVENGSNQSVLGPKAEAILRGHIPTFRITTYEVLAHLFFNTTNAAVKWVKRYEKDGYLQSGLLHDAEGKAKYWYLTPDAARKLVSPKSKSLGHAPGSKLARFYGMLLFCCLGEVRGKQRYTKLTPPAFAERFPQLAPDTGLEAPESYYVDHDFAIDGKPALKRLGYLLVDTSRELRSLIHKYNTVVRARLGWRVWVSLAERDRFIVTILTFDRDRANQIREELERQLRPVRYRIEVFPQLDDVIPFKVKHAPQR